MLQGKCSLLLYHRADHGQGRLRVIGVYLMCLTGFPEGVLIKASPLHDVTSVSPTLGSSGNKVILGIQVTVSTATNSTTLCMWENENRTIITVKYMKGDLLSLHPMQILWQKLETFVFLITISGSFRLLERSQELLWIRANAKSQEWRGKKRAGL